MILGPIIVTILCIHFLLARWSHRDDPKHNAVHKEETQNAPQPETYFGLRPRTIRIQNIPPSFTKQSLVDLLELQKENISVIKTLFGPAPVTTKITNRAVAVVTLSSLPKSLTRRLHNDECQLEPGISQTIWIYLHFRGSTPLNDISANAKLEYVMSPNTCLIGPSPQEKASKPYSQSCSHYRFSWSRLWILESIES